MRSTHRAKHATSAFNPLRSTLAVGLTAVLLPMCLAAPALAQTAPASSSAAASATKQQTVLRLSGPRGTVRPGSQAVAVRLLAGDRPVANAAVRLERRTASGWVYAGRLLTRADGLGSGRLTLRSTTTLRAVYQGSATRTAARSAATTVTVAARTVSLRAAATSGTFRQRAVQVASQQNGKPYRWGSVGPSSFDCSGLIKYSFAKAGKALPRTSGEMYRVSQKISQSAKRPGDLIFMSSDGRIGHVGVYAGNGKFWDAPRAGKNVSLRPIWSAQYYVARVN